MCVQPDARPPALPHAIAGGSADAQHEVILRWLYAAARIMVSSSLWWGTRTVNSRVTDFVRSLTKREHQPLFELLPPQRAALLEEGLLDQAAMSRHCGGLLSPWCQMSLIGGAAPRAGNS